MESNRPEPRGLASAAVLDARVAALSAVFDAVRTGSATTRPELERQTGLGRKVVTQRVAELIDAGLVDEGERGPSTGGRAPRRLRLAAEAGILLVAHFGATGMGAGLTDVSGRVLVQRQLRHRIDAGPKAALEVMLTLWDELLAELDAAEAVAPRDPGTDPVPARQRVWGAGIGVPGPVEFATARPMSPPIMPGWDDFPIREQIQRTWNVPVWVDNDVNAMALGELRAGVARGRRDLVYVKVGTGIGAGIVSRGNLHRGALGVAGDIGHIPVREPLGVACRCGRLDCVEAVAGGGALIAAASEAATSGRSRILAGLLERDGELTATTLAEATEHGDPTAIELLRASGRHIGEIISILVNTLNPELIVLGGPISDLSDLILASVRQAVYERSLPLATRDLVLTRSRASEIVGLTGTAFTVIDEIFAPDTLDRWIGAGRPDASVNATSATG